MSDRSDPDAPDASDAQERTPGASSAMIEGKPDAVNETPREEASDLEELARSKGRIPPDEALEECLSDVPLTARVEALLLATDRPLGEAKLAALLGLPGKGAARRVEEAIGELNRECEAQGRSYRVERLAGGWQLLTTAEFGALIGRLHRERQQSRLSQAALETLSIVAYRQPIMRAEIEAIRGVSCGEVLRGLLERRLVKIVGRSEELGRPMLYGTTKEFLNVFGLAALQDLPEVEGLKMPGRGGAPRPAALSRSDQPEGPADESEPEEVSGEREADGQAAPRSSRNEEGA